MAARLLRLHVNTECIVALESTFICADRAIMYMHMLTGLYGLACEPNNLVISTYWLSGVDRPHGHLVPGRYQAFNIDIFNRNASKQLLAGDDDIILSM
jgi:hypothetical protein